MGRYLPVANPPNPFASATFEYELEDNPGAPLQVYEDHTRTILATNDSPDIGFRWSVNPYRGCHHGCAYCVAPDTPVLMADGSSRAIRDVAVGDRIYGTKVDDEGTRRFVKTQVQAHWSTVKRAFKITLEDGTELVASGDHRFLSGRGFRHVTKAEEGSVLRPFLTKSDALVGFGGIGLTPGPSADYRRGYLAGASQPAAQTKRSRLTLLDLEPSMRVRTYVAEHTSDPEGLERVVVVLNRRGGGKVDVVRRGIVLPATPSREWCRGLLAALFDMQGSFDDLQMVLHDVDDGIVRHAQLALGDFGFEARFVARTMTFDADPHEHLRLLHQVDPAARRKCDLTNQVVDVSRTKASLAIASIDDLGFDMPMFDITTGTEDFIANGVVSHNCYARPGHEYLSFGAGSDFERKIVVKPDAPRLLREAFDKKSWTGELVMFSGVTDCYQPLEHKMRLTRGCLEACVEYRNPAAFITKSPVIERDIDLLAELTRVAKCRVTVSIPFWNPEYAKAMEPFVTTPARRMKIVETLAKAGIAVGVSVSPIVPGLNDQDIGEVLEAAANAGAKHAFWVMLRLPGSVKDVFTKAMEERLPLRAEKVLRRLREMHGGKLYDSRWTHRQTGEGHYAQAIDTLFSRTAERLGLRHDMMAEMPVTEPTFRRPAKNGQTSFGF